jgi:diadenosine tetraphosphate (Ap4A) HIT family hydrolase
MNLRAWDRKGKYEEGFVKEYKHWVLEVSFRQHTLGCFIIFAKRKVEKISDLENKEITELKSIMKEYETTLSKMKDFRPDRFNYWQMGNGLHHLHFHAIPRYASSRKFFNKEWKDKTFGHPSVWSKTEVDRGLILKIKEAFLEELRKFRNSP